MHDIRTVRDDPAAFTAALQLRGVQPFTVQILSSDSRARTIQQDLDKKLAERNTLAKQGGQLQALIKRLDRELKTQNQKLGLTNLESSASELAAQLRNAIEEFTVLTDLSQSQSYLIEALERAVKTAREDRDEIMRSLPNIAFDNVPLGKGESENLLISQHGELPTPTFLRREHDDIGPALGLDFETGVAIAGARFTLLRGHAARLQRALGQFMLDRLVRDHGYEEVAPPVLVRGEAMYGTGQLPKFAEESFQTTDGRWLIPTAEVSLTNIVAGKILSEAELPLRFAALTPCFRSEAGAAGRDTRGLIRQHQFDKVEMVSIVTPDTSDAEHERMTACAEGALDALALPYRRMLLCAGDMGFTAARTYDLEVWLPGQARYREISSCSTCTDFQARRMNARYRPEGEKGTRFVHTLNGSGLAVGRTLVAVIENYQQADGSVVVPEVLRPYMGGLELLEPRG